jgi:hypothetical protein
MKKTPPGKEKPAKDKNNKDTFIRFRISSEAFNRVAARAQKAGYSVGAYCRMRSDEEDDGMRARRRPTAESEHLTGILGNLGSIRALHNQMAHQANIHGFDPSTFDDAQEAALKYRDFLYQQMGRTAPPAKSTGPRPPRSLRPATPDAPPKMPPGSESATTKFGGGTQNA